MKKLGNGILIYKNTFIQYKLWGYDLLINDICFRFTIWIMLYNWIDEGICCLLGAYIEYDSNKKSH